MKILGVKAGKGRISAWPIDRLGVGLERRSKIGLHLHLPVLAPVHQMCTGVLVSSLHTLSTAGLNLSQFQSKAELWYGPFKPSDLNDGREKTKKEKNRLNTC